MRIECDIAVSGIFFIRDILAKCLLKYNAVIFISSLQLLTELKAKETMSVAEEKLEHVASGLEKAKNLESEIWLLNAIKNRRRIKLARILLDGPQDIRELQRSLKKEGYYHSIGTIKKNYAGPLERAGIIANENGKYRLTDLGMELTKELGEVDLEGMFPHGSRCYEESCLLSLKEPRNYDEMLRLMPKADLQRTIRRLRTKGLVTKLKPNRHVTYRITINETEAPLSETEERVLRSISKEGSGVAEISRKAGISMRRTFKYLKRLREKGLVSSNEDFVLLSLTDEGRKVAEKLQKIMSIMRIKYPIRQPPDVEDLQKTFSSEDVQKSVSILPNDRASQIRRGRFATKRDLREKQLYELILDSGEEGIMQARIGTLLQLPSREISRIISRLETWKLIRKEKTLFCGRNTFRIVSTRKPPSLKSILGAPCINCPDANRCEGGNEIGFYGGVFPQECLSLEKWIMSPEKNSQIEN